MRCAAIILLLFLPFTALGGDLDVLWEYEFFYHEDLDAVGSCEDYHAADDFQVTADATIKGFECWCVFAAGIDYDFTLTIYEDDNGHPGNSIWSAFTNDVTFTDTGYQDPHSSDPILHCDILIDADDYFVISQDINYWLEIYQEELTYFNWLVDGYYDGNLHHDTGDGFENVFLNAFFVVNGNWGSSVEETSWGEIKATYH
ncbi:hypothetical protein KAU45_02190 [bacterium]|nr:hypothetical protein [bacterium]